eukprot:30933-Amphidinium_carterae.1
MRFGMLYYRIGLGSRIFCGKPSLFKSHAMFRGDVQGRVSDNQNHPTEPTGKQNSRPGQRICKPSSKISQKWI